MKDNIVSNATLTDQQGTPMAKPKNEKQQAKFGLLKRFAPVAIIAGGLGVAYSFGVQDYFSLSFLAESRESLTSFVDSNFALSAASFVLLYTLAVAFSFPAASILTVFGGFLFGWWAGGLLVALGATLGATAIFLAARSAFGDFLKERMPAKVKNMAEGFEKDALSYLLVLRLAPVLPFFVTNIAPALFNVKVRDYVVATFFGIMPGTFAYAWLGQGVDSVLVSAAEAGTEPSIGDLVTPEITAAFVALAVVAAIPVVVRKFRPAKV